MMLTSGLRWMCGSKVLRPLAKANSRNYSPMKSPVINTAAMLVIGDEVLNGKIKDTNSQYFAQYCFELGINLRRIAVVPDEKEDIADTLNQLRAKYDFIVTTGGIGPTHDDITYESVAHAFGLELALDGQTVTAMDRLSKHRPSDKPKGSRELEAQLRMAMFPQGSNVERIFVNPELWVPVVALDKKVYIFPGIPSLYKTMMEGLRPQIAERVDTPKLARRYVSTTTPESMLAALLSDIHHKYASEGVKIGSYPHFKDKRNTVSVLGPEEQADALQQIVEELLQKLETSKEISPEEEAMSS